MPKLVSKFDKAKHVAKCLELAILLEVSSGKPGNVNLVVGFEGTRIEHFITSAVAASSSFEEAARRGIAVSEGKLAISNVEIGKLIKDCLADIDVWQKGGNTLLGTIMLFIPMAVAAGMTPMKNRNEFNIEKLRENLKIVVESTSSQDAVYTYEGIDIAKPSGLNGAPDLDVTSKDSKIRLLKENVSLFRVFKIAANYDDICYEWINNYAITFEIGYPFLKNQLITNFLNVAVINTFLKILSERPDTFISRKIGLAKALKVSKEAKSLLKLGGGSTSEGKKSILRFDKKLRRSGNDYNPGTTADITAATIALCTLSGLRP